MHVQKINTHIYIKIIISICARAKKGHFPQKQSTYITNCVKLFLFTFRIQKNTYNCHFFQQPFKKKIVKVNLKYLYLNSSAKRDFVIFSVYIRARKIIIETAKSKKTEKSKRKILCFSIT